METRRLFSQKDSPRSCSISIIFLGGITPSGLSIMTCSISSAVRRLTGKYHSDKM